jgi:hypothetical protein
VVTTVIMSAPDAEAVPGASLPGGTEEDHGWAHGQEEGAMSEQPNEPVRPDDDESPPTRTDTDAAEHGAVRTEGETAVDEAMGTGDNVH